MNKIDAGIVSKSGFARRLGVTRSRISALIKRGLPVRRDGKIAVADALQWVKDNCKIGNTFLDRGVNMLMAAQKSAGLMAKGAAAPGDENWQRGFKNNPRSDYEQRESPITLAEAGIDKNLAQRAREAEPVDAAGNSPDFWSTAEAIRRKEIAVAKLKELEFEQRSGRLLDAAEVESSWRGQLTDLRRRMLTIPSRCGARLSHLSRTEVSEIDSEIRLALHELSGAKEE